jgi:DNA-binding transcriptional LysR family regulator
MISDLLRHGGLSLDRLQSFCLVAEAGGVTKAARGDPVRQSLFSRQVKELEEFFGVELVRRKGRGIVLTAAGERLHRLAREQLLALSDFKRMAAGQSVELTLAAGDSLIQWLLLPRLRDIRDKLPNVTFRMLNLPTTEIATRLRDGMVDVGLVRAGSVSRGLRTSALGTMTFSWFVPTQMLPSVKAGKASARTLFSLPLATLEGAGQFRQELERVAQRQKCPFNIHLELSSFPLVARALQTGRYAAILPSIAAPELGVSGVVELRAGFLRPLSRDVVMAWNLRLARVRAALTEAIPVFRELCQLSAEPLDGTAAITLYQSHPRA